MGANSKTSPDSYWFLHKKRLTCAEWRASLKAYQRGTIRKYLTGSEEGTLTRIPRIAIFGQQNVGKSDFSNSLLMAWNDWEEYIPMCPLSTTSMIGTYVFDGPFHFMESEENPRVIFDVFDTAGFKISQSSAESCKVICGAIVGDVKPGKIQTPAVKATDPILVRGTNIKAWEGVDAAIVLANYGVTASIDMAVGLYNELKKNSIRALIVLTHSGNNTKNDHIETQHGTQNYLCVESFGLGSDRNEEKSLKFLRVAGEMLHMLETVDRPVRNRSMAKYLHDIGSRLSATFSAGTVLIIILIVFIAVLIGIILTRI